LNNIFSENITWSVGIIVILLGIIAAHRLVLYREKRNKCFDEGAKFRGKILSELEGIYPIPGTWQIQDYFRFRQSIPKVESAAAEFGHFISRKSELEAAVKGYREYCWKVSFEGVSAWHTYKSSSNLDPISPEDRFKQIIEHLFSFTVKK
jgi:hypothetical protein